MLENTQVCLTISHNSMTSPAARVTLAESVLEQLLEEFQQGLFKPGDRLPTERELMERFSVGRSTIREALQSLTRMQLIEGRPGFGTIVKPFEFSSYLRADVFAALLNDSVAQELLEAREVIEVAIVERAVQHATEADLAAIAAILEAAETAYAAGEPTYEYAALFHIGIAQAAHNSVLLNFMHSIHELLKARGRRSVTNRAYLRWEIDEHQALFATLRARDSAKARLEMLVHLRESARRLGEQHQPDLAAGGPEGNGSTPE
jgi:GntR family transcriptional regulator, transcriptional repressor for pyruvate dehydrogenase complex